MLYKKTNVDRCFHSHVIDARWPHAVKIETFFEKSETFRKRRDFFYITVLLSVTSYRPIRTANVTQSANLSEAGAAQQGSDLKIVPILNVYRVPVWYNRSEVLRVLMA